jgi:hypothetical protein
MLYHYPCNFRITKIIMNFRNVVTDCEITPKLQHYTMVVGHDCKRHSEAMHILCLTSLCICSILLIVVFFVTTYVNK